MTTWLGYKAHLTETCEDDLPHLIVHVETTAATVVDERLTPVIHTALQARDLLPAQHLVDTGYADADLVASSPRDFGVDLVAPARSDRKPQARGAAGFEAACFTIDWQE